MLDWRVGATMTLAAVLGVAAVVSAQPEARQMGGIGITVYDNSQYRGENATFRSDQPDLGRARFANRISSLQVAPGEVWEVCEGTNYRPPCQVFSGAEPDLGRRSWNDRISSLRRVRGGGGGGGNGRGPFPPNPPGGNGMVLFSDTNFRGTARPINGPTSSLGSFNDRAESLRIYSGVWEICEDNDYGKCRTADRDWPNLSSFGLSKRISSVRPLYGRGGGGGGGGYPQPGPFPPSSQARLTLFERDRFRGDTRAVDGPSGSLGGFGNRAQSVRVVGTWQLCDGQNFTGRCVTLSQDVPNLASYGMNGRISSARPIGIRPR